MHNTVKWDSFHFYLLLWNPDCIFMLGEIGGGGGGGGVKRTASTL